MPYVPNEHCKPSERWVCTACGKYTEPGASRDDMGDTSCVHWAIRCHRDRVGGLWRPVDGDENGFAAELTEESAFIELRRYCT